MYTYRIYLDGGNLVIGTYESNVLKGEAKHLPRGLVAVAGNTNTTITLNRVVNNLPTLANIEHPDLRDSNGNVWGANRTAVIAAINSFIQSTGGGNVISVNGQTGTVSLGLQNLVNVTTITPTQGDVLSYNSSGNWVLNSGLQYLLSKVKSATATQTSLEVDNDYKINIDATQGKTTIVHAGASVATFGAQGALLPGVTVGTTGTTYGLPAVRGTADGQVPVFNASNNTTSFQDVKVADLSGNTDDLPQGTTNLFFTSAEQSKLAGIQSGAEVNVNADWNSSSGDSQILNKPTLSTVATSGSYNDLSNLPSIPAAYTDSSVDTHLNTATATTGQILSWTGSDYDWVLDAAGAPAGTVGQLQYNNSGIFGASSNLFWDISNSRLGIGTTTPTTKLQVAGDIGFTDGATRYIKLADRTVAGNGNHIIIEASNANTTGTGGNIYLYEGTGAGGPGSGTIFIGKGAGDRLSCTVTGRLEIVSSGPNVGTALRVNAGGIQSFTISWDNINGFRGYGLGTGQSRFLNSTSYTFDNNLLIGTNTNSTYKLDVNGTTRIQSDLTVTTTNATGDFATIDASNILRKRTAAEVLTDIGAQAALTNPITGTGASGQVAFWNASNTQTGDNGLFWDNTNKRLGIGTITPSQALDVNGVIKVSDKIEFPSVIKIGSNFVGNIGGTYSIYIGHDAGKNDSQPYNVLVGFQAGAFQSKIERTSIGSISKAGNYSVAIGRLSSADGSTDYSVSIGNESARYTSGSNNVSIGYQAAQGIQNSSSFSNTVAVGYQALKVLTTGANNTALGYQAGLALTTGASNTLIGPGAGKIATAQSSGVVIGNNAGSNTAFIGSNVFIGNNAAANWGVGDQVVAIGNNAAGTTGSGQHSIFIGGNAGAQSSGTDGSVVIGMSAGFFCKGVKNVLLGGGAGYGSGTPTYTNTVAVGFEALKVLSTGTGNVAIGYQALDEITTGVNNTAVGYDTNTSGNAGRSYTNLFGYGANALGNYGTAIGWLSSASESSVSIGTVTNGNGTSQNSIMLGYETGRYSTGNNNVYIGYQTGQNCTTGAGNLFLGYQAGQNAAGSNKLYIENSNSATPLIYGEFDTDLVRINGSFQVTSTTTSAGLYASNQTELRLYELTANGTNYIALKAAGTLAGDTTYTLPTADGSAGQTLTTDASGNMSWAYPKSPVKSEAGTAYDLVLADAGKYIRMTATTAITVTIPQNIFAVGDEFFFEQNNTGQVTVAAGTGVTLRNTTAFLSKTAERYAIVGLKCVASNEFVLTGERELV